MADDWNVQPSLERRADAYCSKTTELSQNDIDMFYSREFRRRRDESKRQVNKMATATESATIVEDLKDTRVPNPMYWSVTQVAEWVEELGFPHYKSCFETNLIDGRKLIRIEASAFPRIGITDFEHIKIIAKSIRDLLTVEEPDWTRSISLPPRSDLGMYLEQKSARGKQIDTTTLIQFEERFPNPKWRPPLANHCLILPHD